MTIRKRK